MRQGVRTTVHCLWFSWALAWPAHSHNKNRKQKEPVPIVFTDFQKKRKKKKKQKSLRSFFGNIRSKGKSGVYSVCRFKTDGYGRRISRMVYLHHTEHRRWDLGTESDSELKRCKLIEFQSSLSDAVLLLLLLMFYFITNMLFPSYFPK